LKKCIFFTTLLLIALNINAKVDLILFLNQGKIFSFNSETKKSDLFLKRDSNIVDFKISPNQNFLAYSKLLKVFYEEPSEEIGGYSCPIHSIGIIDLRSKLLIKEIRDTSSSVELASWIDIDKLVFAFSGCLDMNGYNIYTVNNNKKAEADIEYLPLDESTYVQAIISTNGHSKFHIDNNLNLHKYSLLTKSDVAISTTSKRLFDCETSNNEKTICWFELESIMTLNADEDGTRPKNDGKLFSYSLANGQKKELYSIKASETNYKKRLHFSPNDSLICLDIDNHIIILNLFTNTKSYIIGQNPCWITNDKLLFSDLKSIYSYDIRNKQRQLFLRNGSAPTRIRMNTR
jgi:hypothetical protein